MYRKIESNSFLTGTARKIRSVPVKEQLNALQSFAGEKLNNI